jgi:hypothetical protein
MIGLPMDAAAVVAADRVIPRHSPSTIAPWHFRASRRPFLFASLDAAAHGAHERAGEFRREHSAVRPGVADVRR